MRVSTVLLPDGRLQIWEISREGRASLSCVVNTEGMCEDIRVTESLDTVHGLDAEAVWTAMQWRFTPGTVNGSR